MQIVKTSETKVITKKTGTYNKVDVQISMTAGTVNSPMNFNDFNPDNVNLKVILKRQGKLFTILNNNLKLLALSGNVGNLQEFTIGTTIVPHGAGILHELLFTLSLPLGSHIRLSENDELTCEVSLRSSGVFGILPNENKSFVAFDLIPSIGYMYGIPENIIEGAVSGQLNQRFNLGNNVTKIVMLSTTGTNLSDLAFSGITLTSDKLTKTMTDKDVIQTNYQRQQRNMYNKANAQTFPSYPQTFILFDADFDGAPLDNTTLEIKFNSGVDVSGNKFIAYTRFETDEEILKEAVQRRSKHKQEFVSKNKY